MESVWRCVIKYLDEIEFTKLAYCGDELMNICYTSKVYFNLTITDGLFEDNEDNVIPDFPCGTIPQNIPITYVITKMSCLHNFINRGFHRKLNITNIINRDIAKLRFDDDYFKVFSNLQRFSGYNECIAVNLAKATKLRYLTLNNTVFNINDIISKLTNLRYLSCKCINSQNLVNLQHLTSIDFGNYSKVSIADLLKIPQLKSLSFDNQVEITGPFVEKSLNIEDLSFNSNISLETARVFSNVKLLTITTDNRDYIQKMFEIIKPTQLHHHYVFYRVTYIIFLCQICI